VKGFMAVLMSNIAETSASFGCEGNSLALLRGDMTIGSVSLKDVLGRRDAGLAFEFADSA